MAKDTEFRNARNPMQIADDASGGRPASRKPKWERAGMTRAEYERGVQQLADEKRRVAEREERIARVRKGQSNPGN